MIDVMETGTPPILLCACRTAVKCHRTHIATLVAKRTGCEVVHLPLLDRSDEFGGNGYWEAQLDLALDIPRPR